MSYGSASRRAPIASKYASSPSAPRAVATSGDTGKPNAASACSVAECVAGCASQPSTTPRPYAKKASGRAAVTSGSSWRSDPAAPLRGFASGRPPVSRMRALYASKPARGMYTSPRTSRTAGIPACPVRSFSGISPIVRRFAVTSSPVAPSPRVAPRANTPCS